MIGGLDYIHYDWTRRFGFNFNVPDLNLAGVTDFSRFRYRTFIPRPALTSGATQGQDQVGLYLQEQAKWDRFVLTLTGRHDWVSQATTSFNNFVPGAAQRQDDTAFTYRLGLNYLLTPSFVPYASYATTFTPQLGADASGRAFKPATGDQIEAGVKFAVPNTNITGSVAGFDIVQSSILRQDPTNPANAVATGSVESKGFEAELTANFAPGTNVTLAFNPPRLPLPAADLPRDRRSDRRQCPFRHPRQHDHSLRHLPVPAGLVARRPPDRRRRSLCRHQLRR